jgi:hypothetical protein
MAYFRDQYLRNMKGCTVLDVGAAQATSQMSYRSLFRDDYAYVGMDVVQGRNVDVVGYENLGVYDVVISGQTMEHVERPWEWLSNLAGHFRHYICVIAPNTWPLHPYPIDCYRFWPDGMRALFEYARIDPVKVWSVGCDTIGIGMK